MRIQTRAAGLVAIPIRNNRDGAAHGAVGLDENCVPANLRVEGPKKTPSAHPRQISCRAKLTQPRVVVTHFAPRGVARQFLNLIF